MTGCSLPDGLNLDGISLVGAVHGISAQTRDSIFAEFHGMQYGLCSIRMIRDAGHKLVLNLNDRNELYDLRQDPHELQNLAGAQLDRETEARLYARMLEWMKATSDPLLKTMWGSAAFDPEYSPPEGTMWFG
jgi:arylsulfatase A-like enzyme